jgi:23S rRNA (cytidine1920-2'-O)/16S rRNA (cytidine1409-2'-O)-methyltransferase
VTERADPEKIRLDELVQKRTGVSRSKAQGLIRTGKVRGADGEPLDRPGRTVSCDVELTIDEGPPYVSRGGVKLEAALDGFQLDPAGKTAIDVGASTGGFTDCLLQRGAAKVYAVDVGYGQLDWRLRQDPRVVVMERTNIREMTPQSLPDPPEFFTADCSFISLRIVLPSLRPLLADTAEGVALIKPQFEAGREEVGKGGVVRDPAVHERVIADVRAAAETAGFDVRGVINSPLEGPAGNREFLAHLVVRR